MSFVSARFCLAAGLVVAAPIHAQAPTLSPRTPIAVQNDTLSALLFDAHDPARIYVVPPGSGSAELTDTQFHPNSGLCSELIDLSGQARALTQRAAELAIELEPLQAELDALSEQRFALLRRAAEVDTEAADRATLLDLEIEIETFELEAEDLRRAHGCTFEDCPSEVQADLLVLFEVTADLAQARDVLAAESEQRRGERAIVAAELDALDQAEAALEAGRSGTLDEIARKQAEVFELYRTHAQLEGATARIEYRVSWDENIAQLGALNPHLAVGALPISRAKIHANFAPGLGTDGYLTSLPAVLGYRVNGQEFDPAAPDLMLPAYPNALTVELRLSLIAACPLLFPDRFDLEKSGAGVPLFAASVTYDYPIAQPVCGQVRINDWQLAQSLWDGRRFRDASDTFLDHLPPEAFSITWCDPNLPEQERDRVRRERARSAIDQLLARIAFPNYLPLIEPLVIKELLPPALPEPPVRSTDLIELYAIDRGWARSMRAQNETFSTERVLEFQTERWARRAQEEPETAPMIRGIYAAETAVEPMVMTRTPAASVSAAATSLATTVTAASSAAARRLITANDQSSSTSERSERLSARARRELAAARRAEAEAARAEELSVFSSDRIRERYRDRLLDHERRERETIRTVRATRAERLRLDPLCGLTRLRCPGVDYLPGRWFLEQFWAQRWLLDQDRWITLDATSTVEQVGATYYIP